MHFECGVYGALTYNRHRYYNPNTGRFLTPDPIKLAGGLNNYQYVPNPTGWVDPLGLNNCPDADGCKAGPVEDPTVGAKVNEGAPNTPNPDFYVGPSGPDSTLPATGYRYMGYQNADGTVNVHAQNTIDTHEARLSYFGFEKFETGDAATEAFQVRAPKHVTATDPDPAWSDGRLRLKFDTLQLYKDGVPNATVPYEFGGKGPNLEPFTKAYPEYGPGGAQQLIPKPGTPTVIKADEVTILPEK